MKNTYIAFVFGAFVVFRALSTGGTTQIALDVDRIRGVQVIDGKTCVIYRRVITSVAIPVEESINEAVEKINAAKLDD
jgi:hypothetical protein